MSTKNDDGSNAGKATARDSPFKQQLPDALRSHDRDASGTDSGQEEKPSADGFQPGDKVEGWIPGSEGQMLQQKVKEKDLSTLPTAYQETSGASTFRGAASQLHDETPKDRNSKA